MVLCCHINLFERTSKEHHRQFHMFFFIALENLNFLINPFLRERQNLKRKVFHIPCIILFLEIPKPRCNTYNHRQKELFGKYHQKKNHSRISYPVILELKSIPRQDHSDMVVGYLQDDYVRK